MLKQKSTTLIPVAMALFVTLAAALMLCACSSGGAAANPPGGGTPTPTKSATPDNTTIVAVFDTQAMRFSMGSGVNAFEPGADVHVFDPSLNVLTTVADINGAINIVHEDMPATFINAPGTLLTITQVAPGKTESDSTTTTIQLV